MFEHLNRHFSVRARIGLIAACCAVPIFVLMIFFINQVGAEIGFIKHEQAGLAYLAEIWPDFVKSVDPSVGLTNPRTDRARLVAGDAAGAAAKAYGEAIGDDKVRAGVLLFRSVADGSNLTLDSDLESFYLQDAASVELPRLIAASSAIAHAASPFDRAVAAQQAQIFAASADEAIRAAIAHGRGGHAGRALARQAAALKAAVDALRSARMEPPKAEVTPDVASVIREADAVWRADQAGLADSLSAQVTRLQSQFAANLALVIMISGLGAWLTIATARGLTGRLDGLLKTMDRLNDGDTTVEVPFLTDAHETGRIAATLVAFKQGLIETEQARRLSEQAYRRAEAAHEAIRENEARLRFLTENMTDLVSRIDRNDRRLFVSGSYRRYGYDPEELIGNPAFSLTHPDDTPALRALIRRLFDGAIATEQATVEFRLRTKAGAWVWMEGAPTLIRDPQGEPVEFIWIMRDIAARKAAAETIAESEARYRLLADRVSDVILRYDLEGVIEFATPSVRRLLGYEAEQMIGRKITEFSVEPDLASRALDAIFRGRPLREGSSGEAQYRRADGALVWIQGNPSTIKDEAGEIVGVVTVLRDVTERRAMEVELRAKRAEAEVAARAKAQFLANMSHEIRTPLTGVIGFAGLLDRLEGLPDKAHIYVNRITVGGRALLSLVNDILDFSKIEAGQIQPNAQPTELSVFIDDAIELIRPQAGNKGLALGVEWLGDPPSHLLIDADRVRQVLLNLVGNAIKFTAAGSISVSVSYWAAGQGLLRLAVTDTGIGIAKSDADRLFQRFSQVDESNTRLYGGAGLGLAISKGLVELMGGEIGVESEEGRGSTFWFTIGAPVADQGVSGESSEADGPDIAPMRILIADDVTANRELVSAMLSPFDIELVEATDGDEAVAAAQRARFNLILMDLQMPRMDGAAAARAIRAHSAHNRNTPIVAISANVLPEHVDACRAAGMNDHVAKPIDLHDLLAKIDRWASVD